MRSRSPLRALAALLPLAALACAGAPDAHLSYSVGTATAAPGPSGPDPSVSDEDPVSGNLGVEAVKRMCDEHLALAQQLLDRIRSLKGAPPEKLTFEVTLGRMDQVMLQIGEAGQLPYLLGVAHPDPAAQEAAKLCEPKTDRFNTALYLDGEVAAVMRAYAAKNESLLPDRKRLLADVLRDFRRNGLELPPEKQKELRRLNDEIVRVGQEFEANLSRAHGVVEVRPSQLDGLPPEYLAAHQPNKDKHGKVEISTDYPDYFPFVTYAHDRKAALELYVSFTNRGGEENVQLLERLLGLRHAKAKLLGYASWADYAVEPRMAKSADAVRKFLSSVRDAVKEPAKAELAELMRLHQKLGGKAADKLPPSDRYYLQDRVRAEKFKFDTKAVSAYFEVGAVTQGLLDVTAEMYGLRYTPVNAKAWHADVKVFEVWSSDKLVGRFYLDLYPRQGKYKHAAMFPIRNATKMPDGRTLLPIAALECNFPRPGATPALMSHEDVVTFFHEFGHVLHHLLTRAELASYSGTNTVRDFVEAPSQMFEEWAWSRDVLDRFARHHTTKEKIPEELFKAMKAARGFGRALDTQRQLFLATLDQELHSRPPGFDSTQVVQEVQDAVDSFGYVKGTHFQSSFGHLIGYDAGYYSYQWALALSRDVLTRFRKEGLMNPKVAASWRDEVLSRGGGWDERSMIKAFLGREPNNEAYFQFVKGHE
jgi:thimet oligopeptidase